MGKTSLLPVVWIFIYLLSQCHQTLSKDELNGKHLRIVPTQVEYYMRTTMNSSGYVVDTRGIVPEIVDWLARYFHFSYNYVPSSANLFVDDDSKRRGKIGFLKSGDADLVVGVIALTPERFKEADFIFPWSRGPFIAVIPYPKTVSNVKWGAIIEPWSTPVWIAVLLAVPLIIGSFYGVVCYIGRFDKVHNLNNSGQRILQLKQIIDYVLSSLLSQGAHIYQNKLAVRFVAGAWCISCFVLIQSYNCTLTSVFTLPTDEKPLIKSFYDIPKIKDLKIVVARGVGIESIIMSADSGILSHFKKMLREDLHSRCNSTTSCLERVKSEFYVYIEAFILVQGALLEDFKKTGVCQFSVAKEKYWSRSLTSFIIAKNSPYMEQVNRGMMQMIQLGLIDKLTKMYTPKDDSFCFNKVSGKKPQKFRLNLKSLASAFVVLFVGYAISLIAFISGIIIYHRNRSS